MTTRKKKEVFEKIQIGRHPLSAGARLYPAEAARSLGANANKKTRPVERVQWRHYQTRAEVQQDILNLHCDVL